MSLKKINVPCLHIGVPFLLHSQHFVSLQIRGLSPMPKLKHHLSNLEVQLGAEKLVLYFKNFDYTFLRINLIWLNGYIVCHFISGALSVVRF